MPITPVSSKPVPNTSEAAPVSIWQRDISVILKLRSAPKTPLRELSVFCRKLSILLDAGVPIRAALTIVSEQLPGRGIRRVLPGLTARVVEGQSFSSAAKASGAFPSFFCGFVAIGETTARLPQVMEQLADFYEDQAETRDELIASLMYPIIVTIMMLGVIILAVTFVLPGYSRIFAATDVPLPALTRGLLQVSEFMAANVLLVMAVIFSTPLLVVLALNSNWGRNFTAAVKLRIPITRQGVNFLLTQALHLLLSAGLPVSQALPLAEGVMDNIRVRRDIGIVRAQLGMGKPFWEALSEIRYIDPLLVGLARVGEETGRMQQTMDKCQAYYAQSYKRAIKKINKLVDPIITMILGIGLGIIMLAVILPTFELATII